MNKQIAANIIKLLNEVPIKGHETRQVMNEAVGALLEIANKEDKEEDGAS